jgi:hypothetical protein
MSTDIVEAGSALEPRINAFFVTKISCDVDGILPGSTAGTPLRTTPRCLPSSGRRRTAIELDTDGLITSITSVYDSRQLTPPVEAALVAAATPVHDATSHGSDQ